MGASVSSAPDDHLAICPQCGVIDPASGRVGGAGSGPTVSGGIVSAAGIKIGGTATISAPDDHFTASPHCRVSNSSFRRVRGARGCPPVCDGIILPAGVQIAMAVIPSPDDH